MYRFLLRPRWIAFHLLVVALMVAMVNLAFWQIRRLHEREHFNAHLRANHAIAPRPVGDVVPRAGAEPGGVEWQRVSATGTFEPQQILIRNKVYAGRPGYHVLATLDLADGRALLVDRGWIPLGTVVGQSPAPPALPTGAVEIVARLRFAGARRTPTSPQPVVTELNTIDVGRIQAQLRRPLAGDFVELEEPAPTAADGLPVPAPLPELTNGPHLSYTVQWFIFTVCAAVGWVLVVRKSARARLIPPPSTPATVPPT